MYGFTRIEIYPGRSQGHARNAQSYQLRRRIWQPRCGTVAAVIRFNQCLWDAAAAIDPKGNLPERRGSYGSAEELSELWDWRRLDDVEAKALSFPCRVFMFRRAVDAALYRRTRTYGAFMEGLSQDRREALRQRLRQDCLAESSRWAVYSSGKGMGGAWDRAREL